MQWVRNIKQYRVHFGALALAEKAVREEPRSPALRAALGNALHALGRHEEALSQLQFALAYRPEAFEWRRTCVDCLIELRRLKEAEGELASVMQSVSDDATAQRLRDRIAAMHEAANRRRRYRQAAPDDAVAGARAALAKSPGDKDALLELAVALAKAGASDAAREALSVERHVEVVELAIPRNYASLSDFLGRLKGEILGIPNQLRDPIGRATRGGMRTFALEAVDSPVIQSMLDAIEAQVEAYVAREGQSDAGFLRTCPSCATLDVWSVVFDGTGHQISHIHPTGWVSGVLYVSGEQGPDGRYRGPLVLGHTEEMGENAPWGIREIEPIPGRLVMFPSHVPHMTRPPEAQDGSRIVVAFDVRPVAAEG